MFRNIFFKKAKTEIIIIKRYQDCQADWGGKGIVFYVKNGRGLLTYKYGYLENEALATLIYGDIPLIKFHNDDPYFCPTCEKLVSAGYGLDMSDEKMISTMRETFNQKFISLEHSFENLKALLGILPTGYYAIVDTELCPTNGNGEFFWKLNNVPTYNKASCPVYGGDGLWCEGVPFYLLPTQPPDHFNMEQAEYYRNNSEYRAIAYHLNGSLCALLDGHHKAVAAAMDKKKVKALVIMPATAVWNPTKEQDIKGGISINGVTIHEDELITPVSQVMQLWKTNQLTPEETKRYLASINESFVDYDWPKEVLDSEGVFPDVITSARIAWAGDISNKRLDKIIKHEEILTDKDALNISLALYHTKNPRFKELAFYFCKSYSFVATWHKIYELLATIKDEDVEDFFVEYLIEDDKNHSDIKKIIDDYFLKSKNNS